MLDLTYLALVWLPRSKPRNRLNSCSLLGLGLRPPEATPLLAPLLFRPTGGLGGVWPSRSSLKSFISRLCNPVCGPLRVVSPYLWSRPWWLESRPHSLRLSEHHELKRSSKSSRRIGSLGRFPGYLGWPCGNYLGAAYGSTCVDRLHA